MKSKKAYSENDTAAQGESSSSGFDPESYLKQKIPKRLWRAGKWAWWVITSIATIVGAIGLLIEEVPKIWPILAFIAVVASWLFCVYTIWSSHKEQAKGGRIGLRRFSKAPGWAIGGTVLTTASILFFLVIVGERAISERLNRPELVVVVAKFDGPDEVHGLSSEIMDMLEELDFDPAKISIKPLDRVIRSGQGATVARAIGDSLDADLVIWGWYRVPEDSARVSMHIEVLQDSQPDENRGSSELYRAITASNQFRSFEIQRAAASDLELFMYIHIQLVLFRNAFHKGQHADFELLQRQFRNLENTINSRSGGVFFEGTFYAEIFDKMPCAQAGLMLMSAASALSEEELRSMAAGEPFDKLKYLRFLRSMEASFSQCSSDEDKAWTHIFLAEGYRVYGALDEGGAMPQSDGLRLIEEMRPDPEIDRMVRYHYDQAIELDSSVVYERAKYLDAIGDFPAAIEDFSTLIRWGTSSENIDSGRVAGLLERRGSLQILLGDYYRMEKNPSKGWYSSIIDTSRVPVHVRTGPVNVSALGLTYKGIRDYQLEASYKRHDDDLVETFVREAGAWTSLGMSDRSISALDKYVKLRPDDPRGFFELAELYNQLDQNELAAANLSRALELDPTNLRYARYQDDISESLWRDIYEAHSYALTKKALAVEIGD